MNEAALNTKFVEEELSSATSAALIHSFFNTPTQLLTGLFFAAFTAGITAIKADGSHFLLWAATAGLALTGAARYYTVRTYCSRPLPFEQSDISNWKFRYTLGAYFQAAALGSWAFIAILTTDDPLIHAIALSVTTGLTAAGAGRAYGQQQVFHHQVLLVFGPQAVALFLKFSPYYFFLSFLTVAFIIVLGKISANLCTINLQGLTEEKRANIYGSQLIAAVSHMPHGLATFRQNGRLVVMNPRFREMAKLPPGIIHTDPSLDDICSACVKSGFISCNDAKTVQTKARAGTAANIITIGPVTENRQALSWTIQRMPDGGIVVLVEDISERRMAEEKIAHLATHDGLTDLPNRLGFQNAVEPLLAQGNDHLSALLYMDLDHFKQVNDTLGHPVGDQLLSLVAGLLRQSIREQDIAARFGGDEFAVFLPNMESPKDAAVVAARIVESLSKRYDIDNNPVEIGASVGIALTRPFANYATLLKNADLALYDAKGSGRGIHSFFHPKMAEKVEARRRLEMDFPAALRNSELELYYQPLVNLKSGEIGNCEALLRWYHPIRGFVPPLDIINIAQAVRLMPDLSRWILDQACLECSTWPENVAVAVNMSPTQLKANDFIADIRETLEVSGLPPHRLNIEITEGALLDDSPKTKKLLSDLRDLGIAVSLDDFGTGYSSLSYLHRFQFQKMKVDRTFLDGIDDGSALTVLRGVAKLATDLGMTVAVEGIETSEQLELIATCDTIDEGQGYLFSRPVPAALIRDLLSAPKKAPCLGLRAIDDAPPLSGLAVCDQMLAAIEAVQMTAQEAHDHITRLGISQQDLAGMIGVKLATVRRWIKTEGGIPCAVQVLLRLLTPVAAQRLTNLAAN